MDVDSSLNIVGLCGRIQITNFLICGVGLSLSAQQLTGIAFTIDQSVEHHCKPAPGFTANETTPALGEEVAGYNDLESCYMYEIHNGTLTDNLTTCQYGWEYKQRGNRWKL